MSVKAGKKPKEQLKEEDNPSLIRAGKEIHLRVLDDFFIEQDLPKWVQHKKDVESLRMRMAGRPLEALMKELGDPKDKNWIKEKYEKVRKDSRKLDDDKYDIRGKHEASVRQAMEKTIRLSRRPSLWKRMRIFLHLDKPPVPVDVAFEDLKTHLLITSTAFMEKKAAQLKSLEMRYRESGQIRNAERIKDYTEQVVYEATVVAAGFTRYVSEDQMLEFIRKSERGVEVSFLRYYEDSIPDEVLEKKKLADSLMVFDNYVVAHYRDMSSMKKKVERDNKEKEDKEAKNTVAIRRDPILFGIIKESRNLYYIADWVTEKDDLTLEVLEKIIGDRARNVADMDHGHPVLENMLNTLAEDTYEYRGAGSLQREPARAYNMQLEDVNSDIMWPRTSTYR